MPAIELMNLRIQVDDNAFASIRILEVDPAILGSNHTYKYSLAYVVNGECVMCYDNERGKGDHKHIGANECPVEFPTIENLIASFQEDIHQLRR
ncbi:hypothetical protein DMA59_17905 [Salmonella enterica subsp. enterica serovar Potsdam]|uniref:Uncharacterized protein n=1 Tax=Salmonella potsdam TaxID=597 RepID=A0A5U6HE28_SALPO|nr:DUF6516 family protein [Salmonella enterica]EBQ9427486.1 hypothetical protein [Salmonella enterica subsp. enterica serovar Potsdam]EIU8191548.1 hypothetical protein [Salmonella enterica subsp. enterica serovar Potsdam]EIU8191919.1 hypothetical protein [Salmonella enterica subsp. enterica serovar Potsdam]HDH3853811.1 hypothetical protein [Salmonella enterica subsp. enterica serovar Oranienburg]HDH3856350.1 hypothetical protein [Salmonella enterica subsp. enterica serovar Oranienburg]